MSREKVERNKLVIELLKRGWTMRRVAKEVGLNAQSIIRRIKARELARLQLRNLTKIKK